MKIRLAQMEVVPGNPRKNFEVMKKTIEANLQDPDVDVLVFPELCLSGYLIGDMWEETAFIEDCITYGHKIAEMSTDRLTIIFGNVTQFRFSETGMDLQEPYGNDGRPALLNAAFVAQGGGYVLNENELYAYPKSLLPNYREFEEPRHFQNMEWVCETHYKDRSIEDMYQPFEINGVKVGITVCEDGWDRDYKLKPVELLVRNGAELILNLSCSPFTTGKNDARDRTFSAHAKINEVPVAYVNSIGLQNNGKTVFGFDGSTVAYAKSGYKLNQLPMFTQGYLDVEFCEHRKDFLGDMVEPELPEYTEIEEIYHALKYGVGKYLEQCGVEKVVIGSSGGVDSAVAAALYAEVVGPENLLLVNMPSEFNSHTTISLSDELANNIGCYYTSIPIGESVQLTISQIHEKHVMGKEGNEFVLNLSDFDLENVQARDRSSRILSALSCAFGGVFTNNGNKTEATVGYATLYGDVAGFLAALGDLWKTQVYELGKYLNRNGEVIPEAIFNIIPSAELSADQSLDSGNGDPLKYWYHDKLFKAWVERWNRIGPTEVIQWYYERKLFKNLGIDRPEADIEELFPRSKDFVEDLERWWKLFKGMGIAKRVQAPPVMAVSRRAFGFDYRETLNCVYFSEKYYTYRQKLIGE
jgi:NAD+ synthase (glutamine-hydrolysing)